MVDNDVKRILVTEDEIHRACKRIGTQINKDYKGKELVIIGLLKGCEPFVSDLVKHVSNFLITDYMKVKSYVGTQSTGELLIKNDIDVDVTGKDVIIVDDICDSGLTLKKVSELLSTRGAASVACCVLLDKPEGRKVEVNIKYVGLDIPNEFVVGYGLDYNGYYRNLPYIGVLKEEIYKK